MIDPVQYGFEIDPVQQPIEIDPVQHGVQVDLVQQRVHIDRADDQPDHAFGNALGQRFHRRGEPPAHRAKRRKRIHTSQYRGKTATVTTHEG